MALTKQRGLLYLCLFLCLYILIVQKPCIEMQSFSVPGPLPPPCETALLSHLDRSTLGYVYSLKLMHAGDLHGQQIPIDAYDYQQVTSWLSLMNALIPQSEIAPFLATFYFSSTQRNDAILQLTHFLISYAEQDLTRRWRWYTYGVYLAYHHLKDLPYAYHLAVKLSQKNIAVLPLWVKEMPGSLLMKMHDTDHAKALFLNLLSTSNNLSKEERYFLLYKIGKLNER
jgi:hypothetical protein